MARKPKRSRRPAPLVSAEEAAILEGLKGGPARPFTRADAEAMSRRVQRRALERAAARRADPRGGRVPITVELTPRQKAWIDLQVAMGNYPSAEAYVSALIEDADQAPTFHSPEELERAAIEGLESGPGREYSPGDWEAMRARLKERLAQARRAAPKRRRSA
jgi:Arc/MetJ-type ribon-helix-helix transcriptional regulator